MKTAKQYRAQAKEARQRERDSFARSDTDGFLSQWASTMTAQLADERARILENGGTAQFTGLFHGKRRVRAKLLRIRPSYAPWTQKSMWLLIPEEEDKYGRKWIPSGKRSRIQKQLGLSEKPERAPAWARIEGSGTGLSGNCWVATYRRDGGYPGARSEDLPMEDK